MQVFKIITAKLPSLLIFLALGWVVFAAVTPLRAQAQADASISGTVLDASGAGIAAAKVFITNLETGAQRELATDEAGSFHAPSLPVGRYVVTADKSGFRAEKRTGIVLVVGQREKSSDWPCKSAMFAKQSKSLRMPSCFRPQPKTLPASSASAR